MDLVELWNSLVWPLVRLLASLSLGLLVANLIEALNWTRFMARLAAPLIRLGHMKDVVGASFSMGFFSGMAANTMLAEAYAEKRLTPRELVLANLFNSLPTYFLHLPNMFFITAPFLGSAAVLYVGLTLFAAILRTLGILFIGRLLLPPLPDGCVVCHLGDGRVTFKDALKKSWTRFKRRIKTIVFFTTPIYVGIHYLSVNGFFTFLEKFVSEHLGFLSWLSPQAVSIVVFHMAAEFTAGLAAAGALLGAGDLDVKQVVMALLVGNVLSTPMRAFRHQFPYYAGIFKPAMAAKLIAWNQALRAVSIIVVAVGYYYLG
ncbi:hypothetical protein [Desulfolutivibrio sulfoxidireducens]|uniref:hypothetical protein n=1 Tax=Desulfolutivibrio sulfoxidireducens TaxID=2773299 RepID=UPI00159E2ABC|nr:hypothetical protein [Desulfolutivibrio sulfoxidireducens]QLA19403.1 hypothetical protein GD604_06420 [Desulfolutivibrio sulfoxidireducens]